MDPTDTTIVDLTELLTFSADQQPSNNVMATQLSADRLPATGMSTDLVALVALMLILVGVALVVGTRKSYGAVVPSRS